MMLHETMSTFFDLRKKDKKWSKSSFEELMKEPTYNLGQRIVINSDRLSLEVLLETRKLFRLKFEKEPILLPEFLLKLRDISARSDGYGRGNGTLSDCAYDLTMAKYSNLPDNSNHKTTSDKCFPKATNVDCRNYYRHFLHVMDRLNDQGKFQTQAEQEVSAGKVLQRVVYRNFLRSKMECRRHTPFSVRYMWRVDKHTFYLWYPSYLTAKKIRQWLEENVKVTNSERVEEQKRIQTLIDENFERGYHTYMDDQKVFGPSEMLIMDKPSAVKFMESHMFVSGLSTAVAQKKVEEIHELRPGIATLGEKSLERMILQIFSDLSNDDYKAARIADLYGISKPTLSRFAGSQWFKKMGENKKNVIPVLWENTAKILAENDEFMETVVASGVAGELKKVLEMINSKGD